MTSPTLRIRDGASSSLRIERCCCLRQRHQLDGVPPRFGDRRDGSIASPGRTNLAPEPAEALGLTALRLATAIGNMRFACIMSGHVSIRLRACVASHWRNRLRRHVASVVVPLMVLASYVDCRCAGTGSEHHVPAAAGRRLGSKGACRRAGICPSASRPYRPGRSRTRASRLSAKRPSMPPTLTSPSSPPGS